MVEGGRKEKPSAALAGTRPVFRGLRRETAARANTDNVRPACRDETRFQGIATTGEDLNEPISDPHACRDETRFQGIATNPGLAPKFFPPLLSLAGTRPVFRGLRQGEGLEAIHEDPEDSLAGTRPVFRGLRLGTAPRMTVTGCPRLAGTRPVFRGLRLPDLPAVRAEAQAEHLQGRDPFSGDCDGSYSWSQVRNSRAISLQGRDPFSGDCDRPEPRRPAP